MAYQIINSDIVAKDTQGATRKFNKNNVDIVIAECKSQGITNKYLIAGILATISKESAFKPQNENLNYSAEGLKKTFPSYFGGKNTQPGVNVNDYAKKPEKIANYVYGNRYGNKQPGDGWKYRGRGFNQITFRDIYADYVKLIPNILDNPDLLNNVPESAKSAVGFYVKSFKSPVIKTNYGKSAYDVSDWNEALLIVINATAGLGNSKSSNVVKYNYDKAKLSHQFLIDYLEKNPEGTTVPPTDPSNVNNQDQENSQRSDDQQSDSNNSDSNTNNDSGIPITNLTQIFPPTLAPLEISFNTEDFSRKDKKKFEKGLGFLPFIWYNGIQLDTKDISSFKLYHSGMIPTLDLSIKDTYNIFREDAFPGDDSFITIYLNSRSLNLRSIHMDFKILEFKELGESNYSIIGICDIPDLYTRKYKSYGNMTSHEALKEVSKEMGLGFCSNISDSDDKMTWINAGFNNIDFIKNTINNSYISDDSFQYCYIDFYYNLCYIDVSKELNREISNDKIINGFGHTLLKNDAESSDESLIPSVLSNDKALRQSVSFFSNYEIFNKSTKVSLEKSYRSRSKFYDSNTKELLIFDIESQTSDGNKTLILKGRPSDSTFFRENISAVWLGKQDIYDEGGGNVHKNYNYAISQNRQNLDDLVKVSCKITLPSANFNLYLFQKIQLIFSDEKPSPANDQTPYLKRFTGDWLITNIDFNYDGNSMIQEATLVKRELELSEEEAENVIPKEESESIKEGDTNETSVPENTNELTPNEENEISESSPDEETESTEVISTSVEEVEPGPIEEQTPEVTPEITISINPGPIPDFFSGAFEQIEELPGKMIIEISGGVDLNFSSKLDIDGEKIGFNSLIDEAIEEFSLQASPFGRATNTRREYDVSIPSKTTNRNGTVVSNNYEKFANKVYDYIQNNLKLELKVVIKIL